MMMRQGRIKTQNKQTNTKARQPTPPAGSDKKKTKKKATALVLVYCQLCLCAFFLFGGKRKQTNKQINKTANGRWPVHIKSKQIKMHHRRCSCRDATWMHDGGPVFSPWLHGNEGCGSATPHPTAHGRRPHQENIHATTNNDIPSNLPQPLADVICGAAELSINHQDFLHEQSQNRMEATLAAFRESIERMHAIQMDAIDKLASRQSAVEEKVASLHARSLASAGPPPSPPPPPLQLDGGDEGRGVGGGGGERKGKDGGESHSPPPSPPKEGDLRLAGEKARKCGATFVRSHDGDGLGGCDTDTDTDTKAKKKRREREPPRKKPRVDASVEEASGMASRLIDGIGSVRTFGGSLYSISDVMYHCTIAEIRASRIPSAEADTTGAIERLVATRNHEGRSVFAGRIETVAGVRSMFARPQVVASLLALRWLSMMADAAHDSTHAHECGRFLGVWCVRLGVSAEEAIEPLGGVPEIAGMDASFVEELTRQTVAGCDGTVEHV
jgi:hypothetical protein